MSQLWPKAALNGGTGHPSEATEVADICAAIRKACKGFGTDEDGLIAALGPLDPTQRAQVARRYEREHGKPLPKLMDKECGGDFGRALALLARPIDEAEAAVLKRACRGAGTNEKLVWQTLCGRTNEEVAAIRKAYFRLYEEDLCVALAAELSGDVEKLVTLSLQAMEEDYNPEIHTEEKAEEDARLFDKAGRGRMGTDEEGLFRLICKSPPQHLKQINVKYVDRTGYNLAKSLEKELGGDAEDAAIHTVNMKLKPVPTAAYIIESTMKGMGTDEFGLTAALLRYQALMKYIKPAYEKEYEKSLEERIRKELRGDFEKLLLEMLKVEIDMKLDDSVVSSTECLNDSSISTNGHVSLSHSAPNQTAAVAAAGAAVSGLTIGVAAALPFQATVYNPHLATATATEAAAPSSAPRVVTLLSRNYPERTWTYKARGRQLEIASGDGTSLTMMPGLATIDDKWRAHNWIGDGEFERARLGGSLVSFRTSDGRWLRHRGFEVHADPFEESALFRLDATFVLETSRFFPGYDAFRSVNYAGRYIGHRSFRLRIENANDSDLHRNDASFLLRHPVLAQAVATTTTAGAPAKDVYFLVVAQTNRQHPSTRNTKVLHKSYDLEASKAYLLNNFPRGAESNYPQRMIAEVVGGVVTKDPHKVGGESQGSGLGAGFNKFWWGWEEINTMIATAEQFVRKPYPVDC